jgi:hypothetical protein
MVAPDMRTRRGPCDVAAWPGSSEAQFSTKNHSRGNRPPRVIWRVTGRYRASEVDETDRRSGTRGGHGGRHGVIARATPVGGESRMDPPGRGR